MKAIKIELQYRDAANYRNYGEEIFSNVHNLSAENIKRLFEENGIPMYEGIMVQDYGITSIAPVGNEFLVDSNEYDHPYCEITDIIEVEVTEEPENDIYYVCELVKNKEEVAESVESRKDEAIRIMQDELQGLTGESTGAGIKIVVELDGGLVSSVSANVDGIEVCIIDHDTEGASLDDDIHVIPTGNETGTTHYGSYARIEEVDEDDNVDEVFKTVMSGESITIQEFLQNEEMGKYDKEEGQS